MFLLWYDFQSNQQRATKHSCFQKMLVNYGNQTLMPVWMSGEAMMLWLKHPCSNTITCCLQFGVLHLRSLLFPFMLREYTVSVQELLLLNRSLGQRGREWGSKQEGGEEDSGTTQHCSLHSAQGTNQPNCQGPRVFTTTEQLDCLKGFTLIPLE